MDRRRLLAALPMLGVMSSTAFAAGPPRVHPKILIIGAGIMGASIAYHLARRGAAVTVLDKGQPGGQATQGAFAMLIASHEEGPPAFNDLYGKAVLDWRRLDMELGGAIPVQWGGTLSWAPPGEGADKLRANMRQVQRWGSALEAFEVGDFARLAPGVVPGAFGAGVFSPNQGTVDPLAATEVLIAQAKRFGAEVRFPCEVKGLSRVDGVVTSVQTTQGPIAADVVVIAAGAQSDDLAKLVGAQAPHSLVSGTLAHSRPHPRVLERVLNGPSFSIKQNPDGRIVTGLDYRPGADGTDVSQAYGERLLSIAAQTVPGIKGAALDKMTLGYVPIPKDSQPIVGFTTSPTNLYLALMMSGITMAPLMGRLAAGEILDGLSVDTLAPYRPGRFV